MKGSVAEKVGCGTLYAKAVTNMLQKQVEFCGKMKIRLVRSRETIREEPRLKLSLWSTFEHVTNDKDGDRISLLRQRMADRNDSNVKSSVFLFCYF